ncbi:MAG: hypothetical protein ACI4ET_11375 [Bilifractor sp.]
MIAIEGKVKDNKIVIDNDISAYNGNTVIITILNGKSLSKYVDQNEESVAMDRQRAFIEQTAGKVHVDENAINELRMRSMI